MTNHEAHQMLWDEALRIRKRDLEGAFRDKDWNLCVRRAQEVVELAIKAVLRFLGVDYPKHHDVGPIFVRLCEEKSLSITPEALGRIRQISRELTQRRGLAFYMEESFSQSEAIWALGGADFVLEGLRNILSGAPRAQQPPAPPPWAA